MDDSKTLSLRPITADTVFDFIRLSPTLRDGQDRFVASNAVSLAQAYVSPHAWPRGVFAADDAVGVLMLEDNPSKPEYFLWRLMIGGDRQGKGYGRRAVELLLDYVKTRPGAMELLVSCVQGEGGPEDFYRKLGFEPTGKMYDGEQGLVLPFEPPVAPLLLERSAALPHIPDYAQVNRDNWNRDASNWVESGRRGWSGEPEWGIWHISNGELPLLPEDMRGIDANELGCGTGYVSSWMHRRGARGVGIDPSEGQLDTARMLSAEHRTDIEWIHGVAESVPNPDASFDFAISEYGAAIWADPYVWIPEAHRLLRPGGELVFLGNSPLSQICTPALADGITEERLYHTYFSIHRFDWTHIEDDGGIHFNMTLGDWFRLFANTGFDVTDYREVQAPASASQDRFATAVEWAKRFPSEQTWRLRKRG